MADSNVTKKALATAFKELLRDAPFEKISIGNICRHCNMSRKTFYYHFKDKDHLVNWIFETEFIACAQRNTYNSVWQGIEDLLRYFYASRTFYAKVLRHEGQNSFAVYFNELIYSVFVDQLKTILRNSEAREFQINFIADGMVCMLKRWLTATDCISPDEFIREIKSGALTMAKYICQTLSDENKIP